MDVTVGSTHFKVSLGLLAGIALALFLWLRFGSQGSAALDRWLASGQQEVASRKPFLERQARLQRQVTLLRQHYQVLQKDSVAAYVALSRPIPPADTTARVSFAACQEVVRNCEQRVQHWKAVADSNATGWQEALMRVNRSDSLLTVGVQVTKCNLLHIGPVRAFGCPSRSAAFFLGAGIGLAAGFVLHR
jgi:hypothetical protein